MGVAAVDSNTLKIIEDESYDIVLPILPYYHPIVSPASLTPTQLPPPEVVVFSCLKMGDDLYVLEGHNASMQFILIFDAG